MKRPVSARLFHGQSDNRGADRLRPLPRTGPRQTDSGRLGRKTSGSHSGKPAGRPRRARRHQPSHWPKDRTVGERQAKPCYTGKRPVRCSDADDQPGSREATVVFETGLPGNVTRRGTTVRSLCEGRTPTCKNEGPFRGQPSSRAHRLNGTVVHLVH